VPKVTIWRIHISQNGVFMRTFAWSTVDRRPLTADNRPTMEDGRPGLIPVEVFVAIVVSCSPWWAIFPEEVSRLLWCGRR